MSDISPSLHAEVVGWPALTTRKRRVTMVSLTMPTHGCAAWRYATQRALPRKNCETKMEPNPHVQDRIYGIVGEEVARKEFYPGPMARAVAESQGNRDLVEGLYIKFRFEELYHKVEREAAQQAGAIPCPSCGHIGKPIQKPRGNVLLLIVLFLLYIVPGVVYAAAYSGYKGVCSKCGRTLIKRM